MGDLFERGQPLLDGGRGSPEGGMARRGQSEQRSAAIGTGGGGRRGEEGEAGEAPQEPEARGEAAAAGGPGQA